VLTEISVAGDLLVRESHPPRGLHDSSVERVSVGAILGGRVLTDELGTQSLKSDRLRILDLSSPYKIGWLGGGHTVAFDLECAAVGVSMDMFRAAMIRGTDTPLGDLLRRHLIQVAATAGTLSPTELSAVGASTAQLVRGLILAASDRDADHLEAMATTLLMRIQDYINSHLSDPDLSPERISAIHNISLRQLYLLFSQQDETPSEWIIARRLAAAKADLTYRPDTVSTTAQRWGFKDHSHFSRRFKAAYGVTPHEYSRRARKDAVAQYELRRQAING
jgi:AraC-like DNA-binding protein